MNQTMTAQTTRSASKAPDHGRHKKSEDMEAGTNVSWFNDHQPVARSASMPIRVKTIMVLMIGFSPVIQTGIATMIAQDTELDLAGYAADAVKALAHMRNASDQGHPLDVVLTQSPTIGSHGVQPTRLIKECFPAVAVLVLAADGNHGDLIDAIHADAGAYLFLRNNAAKSADAKYSSRCGGRNTDACGGVASSGRRLAPDRPQDTVRAGRGIRAALRARG